MKYMNELFEINPELYTECDHKGTVTRLDYETEYCGRPMKKYAFVYTPYQYNPEEPCEILYLIHGGLEYAEKYLYEKGEENPLKRAVDHLIDDGTIPPVLIVTPSEYPDNRVTDNHDGLGVMISEFCKEVVNDLVPAVEKKYRTMDSRDHRSVMGWSLGSMISWNLFMQDLDLFSRFAFLSGQASPGIEKLNRNAIYDREWANRTAGLIAEAVAKQGMVKKDFNIFAATGSEDIAFVPLALQMSVLQSYTDYFSFGGEGQNAAFLVWKDGEHHTKWRLQYTINAICQLYRL